MLQVSSRTMKAICLIEELNQRYEEDYARELCVSSALGLLAFIEQYPTADLPLLAAMSKGQILGEWRVGNRSLTLDFVDSYKIYYALFIGEKERTMLWGVSDLANIFVDCPESRHIIESKKETK